MAMLMYDLLTCIIIQDADVDIQDSMGSGNKYYPYKNELVSSSIS